MRQRLGKFLHGLANKLTRDTTAIELAQLRLWAAENAETMNILYLRGQHWKQRAMKAEASFDKLVRDQAKGRHPAGTVMPDHVIDQWDQMIAQLPTVDEDGG